MTKEEFLNKCKSYGVDTSKYDYSLVPNTLVNKEYIDIICKKHGKFTQLAQNHMRNFEGCKICKSLHQTKVRTKSPEQFIKEAKKIWGDKNDYSKAQYIDSNTEVSNIYCTIHNLYFNQIGNLHLRGHEGCKLCQKEHRSKIYKKSNQEFIDDANKIWNKFNIIHGTSYKFDYSNTNYEHSQDSLLKIRCLKHNVEFNQRAHGHLQAHLGCPLCKAEFQSSHNELELLEFLKQSLSAKNSNNIEIQERVRIIPPKEIDIYIPEKKIGIEYNGLYWHSDIFKEQTYHLQKTIDCEKQNIHLIHIFEDEWLYKKDIVKSRLLNLLGKNKFSIGARKLILKQVPVEEERNFLNNNHLQGYVASQVCYGLYYQTKDNRELLVCLMSFGQLRKNLGSSAQDGVYELYRFVTAKGYSVPGGASRLFKHFVKQFNPKQVVSYADRRWSMKSENKLNLYEQLGFKFDSFTDPNYFYIIENKRVNRFTLRKDVLIKEYGCPPSMTEKEFTEQMGWPRIYDVGNIKYVYIPKND